MIDSWGEDITFLVWRRSGRVVKTGALKTKSRCAIYCVLLLEKATDPLYASDSSVSEVGDSVSVSGAHRAIP